MILVIKAIIFDFGRVISAPRPAACFRAYEDELCIHGIVFTDSRQLASELGKHLGEEALPLKSRSRADFNRRVSASSSDLEL